MSESASSEYYETVEIHDRLFQRYSIEHNIYCVPVDEHAAREPRADLIIRKVTAVDIFPADVDDQPENLDFEVWDLNRTLTPTYDPNHYDLIHSRFVAPGIKRDRWPSYVRDLARLLKRNGWVQLVEYYYIIQSDSGLLTDNHALQQWGNAYRQCMEGERDPRIGRRLPELLRTAGLVDVQERSFRMPIGGWPTDVLQRSIGVQNQQNIGAMLESHALYPFTRRFGWTKDQVASLVQRAQQEANDPRLRLYIPLVVAWGRKR
ncbi:hypothetical protein H2201_000119 [Coniosporium apollinis]|uniref:Methyltransferase type 11 domain-containing protein n=2 Tax=Coniosporium TaxID=2810619 RepID=A0ABQ9P582_9PEZI|nr:hypothetical protein H2199_008241 [Cladosporium sp. JES 115]KAJ9669734.1 hypothetical protein H2201_000119 [Coniosporium apollinis]